MSVNPDGMASTDYSDFEYQQVYFKHLHTELSGDEATSTINFETDPLKGIGGLDNNEVAELAWMEVQVNVEHQQGDEDQDVGSETLFKGVVGANLPNSKDLLPGIGPNPSGSIIEESNATAAVTGSVDSEDRVFAPFQLSKHPAFDDQTNGPGGSGGSETLVLNRPYRDMVGRGPVLDSSDTLNVTSQLTQEDEIVDGIGQVTLHCVWDVAETSDAGRAFSVPTDD